MADRPTSGGGGGGGGGGGDKMSVLVLGSPTSVTADPAAASIISDDLPATDIGASSGAHTRHHDISLPHAVPSPSASPVGRVALTPPVTGGSAKGPAGGSPAWVVPEPTGGSDGIGGGDRGGDDTPPVIPTLHPSIPPTKETGATTLRRRAPSTGRRLVGTPSPVDTASATGVAGRGIITMASIASAGAKVVGTGEMPQLTTSDDESSRSAAAAVAPKSTAGHTPPLAPASCSVTSGEGIGIRGAVHPPPASVDAAHAPPPNFRTGNQHLLVEMVLSGGAVLCCGTRLVHELPYKDRVEEGDLEMGGSSSSDLPPDGTPISSPMPIVVQVQVPTPPPSPKTVVTAALRGRRGTNTGAGVSSGSEADAPPPPTVPLRRNAGAPRSPATDAPTSAPIASPASPQHPAAADTPSQRVTPRCQPCRTKMCGCCCAQRGRQHHWQGAATPVVKAKGVRLPLAWRACIACSAGRLGACLGALLCLGASALLAWLAIFTYPTAPGWPVATVLLGAAVNGVLASVHAARRRHAWTAILQAAWPVSVELDVPLCAALAYSQNIALECAVVAFTGACVAIGVGTAWIVWPALSDTSRLGLSPTTAILTTTAIDFWLLAAAAFVCHTLLYDVAATFTLSRRLLAVFLHNLRNFADVDHLHDNNGFIDDNRVIANYSLLQKVVLAISEQTTRTLLAVVLSCCLATGAGVASIMEPPRNYHPAALTYTALLGAMALYVLLHIMRASSGTNAIFRACNDMVAVSAGEQVKRLTNIQAWVIHNGLNIEIGGIAISLPVVAKFVAVWFTSLAAFFRTFHTPAILV